VKFRLILLVVLLIISCAVGAEVLPVPFLEDGKVIDSTPTMTMYWKGQEAKAVLILIPGGDGNVGIKPDTSDLKNPFYQIFKRLSLIDQTSGKIDAVIFDSPYPLSPNQRYPSARGTTDHVKRIKSVVKFYKEKTTLPVWIIGHSNGGISLMEFIKHLQDVNETSLISGMVVSSARNESQFASPIDFPILFMDHKNNGCTVDSATIYSTFEKVKAISHNKVERTFISSGESQSLNPCVSGYHMYYKAGEEVSKVLEDFVLQNTR
jgi:hypothetical protein